MTVLFPRDRLLLKALLASLLLHALIAYVIPAFAVVPGAGPAIETISFARALPIRIETPHPRVVPPRASAPVHARVLHAAKHRAQSARATRRAPARPTAHTRQNVAPLVAAATHAGSNVRRAAAPRPSATAVPTAATVASVETKSESGGYMPLGAEDPVPVLDPAVRHQLAALGVHTTLTIVVGVNGKTKSVAFAPALGPVEEAQIRDLLASASWDPAICGAGVPCESQTTIRL